MRRLWSYAGRLVAGCLRGPHYISVWKTTSQKDEEGRQEQERRIALLVAEKMAEPDAADSSSNGWRHFGVAFDAVMRHECA